MTTNPYAPKESESDVDQETWQKAFFVSFVTGWALNGFVWGFVVTCYTLRETLYMIVRLLSRILIVITS